MNHHYVYSRTLQVSSKVNRVYLEDFQKVRSALLQVLFHLLHHSLQTHHVLQNNHLVSENMASCASAIFSPDNKTRSSSRLGQRLETQSARTTDRTSERGTPSYLMFSCNLWLSMKYCLTDGKKLPSFVVFQPQREVSQAAESLTQHESQLLRDGRGLHNAKGPRNTKNLIFQTTNFY